MRYAVFIEDRSRPTCTYFRNCIPMHLPLYEGRHICQFKFVPLLQVRSKPGNNIESITHDTEIGNFEDGSISILIDGKDLFRLADAHEMLNLA